MMVRCLVAYMALAASVSVADAPAQSAIDAAAAASVDVNATVRDRQTNPHVVLPEFIAHAVQQQEAVVTYGTAAGPKNQLPSTGIALKQTHMPPRRKPATSDAAPALNLRRWNEISRAGT